MNKLMRIFFCIVFISLSFTRVNSYATPPAGVSAALSIIPGLGQIANGDSLEGLGWFVSTVGLFFIPSIGISFALDVWQYQIYDAYRDADPKNKRYQKYSVFSNYLANFNPGNIIDPISAPIVGYSVYYGSKEGTLGQSFKPASLLKYTFVGLGEEGLFRGMLYPAMTDVFFGSTVLGAISSSILFGLAHTQYNVTKKMIVAGLGLLWCIQASRNNYDIRKNIFSHSWYDIFVAPGFFNGAIEAKPNELPITTGIKLYF